MKEHFNHGKEMPKPIQPREGEKDSERRSKKKKTIIEVGSGVRWGYFLLYPCFKVIRLKGMDSGVYR